MHLRLIAPVIDRAIRVGVDRIDQLSLGWHAKSHDQLELILVVIEPHGSNRVGRKGLEHAGCHLRRGAASGEHHRLGGNARVDLGDGRGGLTWNSALGKNRDVAGRALALIGTRPILERTGPRELVKHARAILGTAHHMKAQALSISATGSQVRQLRQLEQKLARHAHGLVKSAARAGAADQRVKRVQAKLFATLLCHRLSAYRRRGNCFVHRDPQYKPIVL